MKQLKSNGLYLIDFKKIEMIVRMAPAYFLEAWLRMQMQLEKIIKEIIYQMGRASILFDSMVTLPGCRNRMDSLWKAFWVLGSAFNITACWEHPCSFSQKPY